MDPGCVYNFVPGIWRNSDRNAIGKFLFCLARLPDFGDSGALFNANKLGCVCVLFNWYKFAGLETHQHQLLVLVGIYDFPIVGVFDGFIFQVDQERHDAAKVYGSNYFSLNRSYNFLYERRQKLRELAQL